MSEERQPDPKALYVEGTRILGPFDYDNDRQDSEVRENILSISYSEWKTTAIYHNVIW